MHKRGLCRHAVSVCLCVCLSRSWVVSKRIKISSKFYHHRAVTPFYFFHAKRDGDIPTGIPLTGASNAGGVGRNARFWANMPAVDAATGAVFNMVAGGRRLPSRKLWHLYRWSYILRVFDHQAPRAIKSPSPWFFSARATKRALAPYTITIDRVHDSKAWRYAEDNRTELNCMHQ